MYPATALDSPSIEPRRHARTLLIAAAFLGTAIHCWRFRDFTVDDAAINYAYSQNLAHGDGLVPTAGGERVEGYSNFLWVILVGLFVAPLGHILIVTKVLGLLLALAITVGSAELTAALRRRRSALDALSAALCAVFLPIPYWSMSGLENPLYLALTIWGCVFLLREAADSSQPPWSALWFAALALTRPDGLVVAAAAAAALLFTRHQARRIPVWILLAGVPVGLHIVWRYSYYAYPWPNTFYVKVAFPFKLRELFDLHGNGWKYVLAFYHRYRLLAVVTVALFALLTRDIRPRLVLFGVLAAVVFFPIYARGDWMSEGRFTVAAMPLLFVLATDGIANIAQLARRIRNEAVPVFAVGAIAAAAVVWAIVPKSIELSNARVHHYPVPVEGVAERARRYQQLARLLGVEEPSVADGDAGGNLLYAGMPLVDIGWLNDVTLAHWGRNPGFTREYIYNERKPTFLRLTGYWLQTHLQDYPEFAEYVNAPNDGDGLYVARSAFTVEGIDPRSPIAHLTDAIDLLGYDATATTFTAWVLARHDRVAGQLLLRSPGRELALNPGEGIYRPVVWRSGDVVKVTSARPPGALHFCTDETCVAVEDGRHGSAPVELPRASAEDVQRLVDRGEWQAAFVAKRARHEATDAVGKALFRRAQQEVSVGQTSAAFDDFQLALRANPALSFARRHLEELRMAPRRGYHAIVPLRLSAAVREFQLSPTGGNLTRVVDLARDARDPGRAVRAYLATKIAPSDIGRLAECYLDAGLPQQAAALIAPLAPAGEADLARFDRIALAAGRRDLFDRWNRAPTNARRVAPGLELTDVSGELSASGDAVLSLTVRNSQPQPAAATRIDHAREIDLGDAWVIGERRRRMVWIGRRSGSLTVPIGEAQVTVDVHPFAADFERGTLDGWSTSGPAFEEQPRTQSFGCRSRIA